MTQNRLNRRAGVHVTTWAFALATALMLTGCANELEAPQNPAPDTAGAPAASQDEQPPAADAGSVQVSVDGREFTFTIKSCARYQDSEIEVSGPGGEAGSDVPSYFDGGLMEMDSTPRGEFRIDIGTDQPFDSTDDFLSIGDSTGGAISVDNDGDDYVVTAASWDAQGTDLGQGTVRITCR